VGIIDAHAGGIGVLGPFVQKSLKGPINWDKALALIGGTSSCHMATSSTPRFIPGVWGPYYGAMIPGMWLNEGGQSATGSLIDYVIRNNSSFQDIESSARQNNMDVYQYLNQEVERLKSSGQGIPDVSKRIHVLPYHLGNRSPRADSHARGVISGLTLDQTVSEVAMHYYATVQAIACGTRHIIEAMNQEGYNILEIYMCGGHTKNSVFLQEHADFTECPIHLPEEKEAVLLGTAILAAVAAGQYPTIIDAMRNMSRTGTVIKPDLTHQKYHDGKYKIFLKMYEHFKEIRDLSSDL
jgi:FGGY-family pentulose kinase